ncbi:MAG TPA: hypothetical protein VMZ52_08965 [Bryobacteraceae bacterium]|nr:hypothetical protein [Bryobacteraceae bacterium]
MAHLPAMYVPESPAVLPEAPEELTSQKLQRIGEGIGRVVYASPHWVVKRERSPSEVVALIMLWRMLRKLSRILPAGFGGGLLEGPSRKIRLLRVLMQAVMLIIPRSLWFTTHVRTAWKLYHRRNLRGARLAKAHLAGTSLVPEQVVFPPTRVSVGGWPGWLVVCEADERVEDTLHQRLADLAAAGLTEKIEEWLDRFLELRQSGWRRGLFSVDAHLKNFGVTGDRIVLLDAGGLTNRWTDVKERLNFEEEIAQPHVQLGLGAILAPYPEIAGRFDARWKAVVNETVVQRHWSGP